MSDDVMRFISDLGDLISALAYSGFKRGYLEMDEIKNFDEFKVVAEYFAIPIKERSDG